MPAVGPLKMFASVANGPWERESIHGQSYDYLVEHHDIGNHQLQVIANPPPVDTLDNNTCPSIKLLIVAFLR